MRGVTLEGKGGRETGDERVTLEGKGGKETGDERVALEGKGGRLGMRGVALEGREGDWG